MPRVDPTRSIPAPALGVCVALAAAILIVYAQVVTFDFVNLDDNTYTYENGQVNQGLTSDGIRWALTTNYIYWQPLTFLSHMFAYEIFGAWPGGHHLVNVFLHVANTLLVFFLLRRMTGALWRSAIAAALFGLHPLRVESVAWVTERKDLLCGLFWLLATYAYIRYVRSPSLRRYLLVGLCFALSLMSKPVAVTFPLFLLLLDWWPLARRDATFSRLIVEKLPLLAMSVISADITITGQREIGALGMLGEIPPATRLANAAVSYGMYLLSTIWPVSLAAIYPYSRDIPAWQVAAAAAVLTAISAAVFKRYRIQRYLAFGWLSFIILLLPNIGILQAGPQARADRFTYLASIGLTTAVVWAAADLLGRHSARRLVIWVAVVPVACLTAVSAAQVRHWRNSEALFERALSVTRDNKIAHNNLGEALLRRGRIDEAASHFREALRIDPDYADCLNNAGTVYHKQGKLDDAMKAFSRAIALKPGLAHAYYNRGQVLRDQGNDAQAVPQYAEALRRGLPPFYASVAHQDLGRIYAKHGNDSRALAHFQQSLILNPGLTRARKYLAMTLANLGQDQQALQEFAQYLKSNPDDVEALKAVQMLRGGRR